MPYGILVSIHGELYLELADKAVKAYRTLEEAKAVFKTFEEKYKRNDHERHVSAGLGLNNLRPKVLELPENANDLAKYLVNGEVIELSARDFGYVVKMNVTKVKPEINDLVCFDITHEVIQHNAVL